MKRSFLYGTYQSIAKRFGILLFILVLIFGVVITISSRLYLERFETMSKIYYEEKLSELIQDTETKISHWQLNPYIINEYKSGKFDSLNEYFQARLQPYGATKSRLLITQEDFEPYAYQAKIMPASILQSVQEQSKNSSFPQYQWIDNKLWLIHVKDNNGYSITFATPISGNSLVFVKDWGYGAYIQSASITKQDEYKNRSITDWDYLRMSYPIDRATSSYLTIEYKIDALKEYFYLGYGIVLAASFLAFGFMVRFRLKSAFKPAIQQLSIFERQVRQIASGDYSRKMESSGFAEFTQLEDEINQLTFAIHSRNEKLKKDVKELYDLLVEVLEQKDPYTRGHSERVADYSVQIARHLGLENLDQIYSAALLHDIGKIAISENILRKPGKLTDLEYDVIKTHPMKGFHLLIKSSQFDEILDGVLYHHERIDGSGYPCGLKGDAIPLQARIIAVADVYDALTSNRSYRDAMTRSRAIAILKRGKGTLFDPSVLECFLHFIEIAS